MYNGIEKIKKVIDYIEANITAELDCAAMAAQMNLSVYEFRRIFSFVIGCPISEYIRKRKLSLAALEIMESEKVDILVSPTACLHEDVEVKLFTRPEFEISIRGRENVPFKIIKTNDFYIQGYSAVSTITDSCCCENVWNDFYEKRFDKKLCTDEIYVSYSNEGKNVKCCIGEISTDGQKVPASRWTCFKMNTVDDDIVNETYSKILYEWLPSANMKKKDGMPTVEVYPFDMSVDGFEWEIRIPIE